MKKKMIDDEKSAIEYVENVLTNWTTFCEQHPKLALALEILLQNTGNITKNIGGVEK